MAGFIVIASPLFLMLILFIRLMQRTGFVVGLITSIAMVVFFIWFAQLIYPATFYPDSYH